MMSKTLNVTLRFTAATLGAYAFAVCASLAMVPSFVFLLDSQLSDAVYAATLWSYVVFFLVFIASFSIESVKKLYVTLMLLSLLCMAFSSFANDALKIGGLN
ncbi:MAG: hypothetical protein CL811_11705 [Colwelliaceae bacterium]|nr:hypothetical protein [Colwelliaceae bacterium]